TRQVAVLGTGSSIGASTGGFAALSNATSNRCDLGAGEVRRMAPSMHLQGACCSPMDRANYRRQVRGLRHYRGLPTVVPADPYDVSVRLVQRLLSYRSVALSGGERATDAAASNRATP